MRICLSDPACLSSLEIDEVVRVSLRDAGSLYAVDADLIAELARDLIVRQVSAGLRRVEQRPTSACPVGAEVLSVDLRALGEVAESYYSRPAPRLADGARQLPHLMHPEVAPDPGLLAIALGRVASVV